MSLHIHPARAPCLLFALGLRLLLAGVGQPRPTCTAAWWRALVRASAGRGGHD
eukprot:COSAG01_NODE_43236_length_431_cov_19.846386_2_plen_52_part_01